MVWWLVGAVVAASLLALAAIAAGLRRRLAELDRVAALARKRAAQAQALRVAAEEISATQGGMTNRAAAAKLRLVRVRRRVNALRGRE